MLLREEHFPGGLVEDEGLIPILSQIAYCLEVDESHSSAEWGKANYSKFSSLFFVFESRYLHGHGPQLLSKETSFCLVKQHPIELTLLINNIHHHHQILFLF